jgi:hypothetical protein
MNSERNQGRGANGDVASGGAEYGAKSGGPACDRWAPATNRMT